MILKFMSRPYVCCLRFIQATQLYEGRVTERPRFKKVSQQLVLTLYNIIFRIVNINIQFKISPSNMYAVHKLGGLSSSVE